MRFISDLKFKGLLSNWIFWLLVITGIAIILRSIPGWIYAVWGCDSGIYVGIANRVVETGEFFPPYYGWGGSYNEFPILYAIVALTNWITGIDVIVIMPKLIPIFGAFTVFIFYFIVKELTDNKKIALLSALILSVSAFHVYQLSHAAPLVMGHFFMMLSIYFFIKFRKNIKYLIPLIISSLILIMSHHFSTYIFLLSLISIVAFENIYQKHWTISLKKDIFYIILVSAITFSYWGFVAKTVFDRFMKNSLSFIGVKINPIFLILIFYLLLLGLLIFIKYFRKLDLIKDVKVPSLKFIKIKFSISMIVFLGIMIFFTVVNVPQVNVKFTPLTIIYSLPLLIIVSLAVTGLAAEEGESKEHFIGAFVCMAGMHAPSKVPDYVLVDGQQRLLTIWRFRNGKFPLKGEINGPELDGLKYNVLPEDLIEQFDTYQLDCVILEGYDDGKVRMLFRKLQRGKPLNPAEKLNAYPGSIVLLMRSLGKHEFFSRSIAFSLKRYKSYWLTAIFLALEDKGIIDISPKNLYDFFRKNKNLTDSSSVAKKVRRTLKYMLKAFPNKTPQLNKASWVMNTYLLTSHLLDNYSMMDKEDNLRNFHQSFWEKAEKVRRTGKGSPEDVRFVDANTSGTTSKKNIETRFNILLTNFLNKHSDLELIDPKRYFDHYEKAVIYRRNQDKQKDRQARCEQCGKKASWGEYDADHIKPHSKGGKTTIENGQVLCRECNQKKGAK